MQEKLKYLNCEQCILLGFMGMARINQLTEYIAASHQQFQRLSGFSTYIYGELQKLLFQDFSIERKIIKGTRICNSLIPVVSDWLDSEPEDSIYYFDYHMVNGKWDYLASTACELIEQWFYFINWLDFDLNDAHCKCIAEYLELPSNMIESYLSSMYEDCDSDEYNEKTENSPLLKRELELIDSDIKFVQENKNKKRNRTKNLMHICNISFGNNYPNIFSLHFLLLEMQAILHLGTV